MDNNKDGLSHRLKRHKVVKLLITFIKSAAVGMLFAVLCFAYDVYHDSEQDKQLQESIDKLIKIEQGLSTRYLGIFPNYIEDIGLLFEDLNPTDTIIIFEDVLYYGFKSKPNEFYEMNKKLFNHSMRGGSVTIAYYNYEHQIVPIAMDIFHNMIKNEHISSGNIALMNKECDSIIKTITQKDEDTKLQTIWKKEYELCDKYFKTTVNKDFKKFEESIDGENGYLSTGLINFGENETSQGADVAKDMCKDIQKIKEKYLKKDIHKITFNDFEMMNREISLVVANYYKKHGIKLVPLNEYLTMSCWMVKYGNTTGIKAVLAFPSKYSSDEIGIYSQDENFAKYISTMLNGILLNQNLVREN